MIMLNRSKKLLTTSLLAGVLGVLASGCDSGSKSNPGPPVPATNTQAILPNTLAQQPQTPLPQQTICPPGTVSSTLGSTGGVGSSTGQYDANGNPILSSATPGIGSPYPNSLSGTTGVNGVPYPSSLSPTGIYPNGISPTGIYPNGISPTGLGSTLGSTGNCVATSLSNPGLINGGSGNTLSTIVGGLGGLTQLLTMIPGLGAGSTGGSIIQAIGAAIPALATIFGGAGSTLGGGGLSSTGLMPSQYGTPVGQYGTPVSQFGQAPVSTTTIPSLPTTTP